MSRRLRLGVIGAGSWAVGSHLPNLARWRDEVDFSIVNRRDAVLVERIRERFGFERATTDWHEVIAAKPDLVVVASPASAHFEQVEAALLAGAHVLCEKPFTVDSREAWRIAQLAEEVQRTVVVAFGWNYNVMVTRAAEAIARADGLGEIEQLNVTMATPARELLTRQFSYAAGDDQVAPRMETWADPALSGGGYGQAQLSHALGLGLWLSGCRASEVFAFGWSPADATVEFHDAIAVRFDNGAVGTVAGASNHTGTHGGRHQLEVRILGSRGQVDLDIGRDTVRAWDAGRPIEVGDIPAGAGDYECAGPVDVLVRAGLGQPVVNASPAELGARTTELIDAAYRSMRSGRMERVASLATRENADGV